MEANVDLTTIWQRLANITCLTFESTSKTNESRWSGEGRGQVVVEPIDNVTMLFHEQGQWRQDGGKELAFTNVYRWTALHETESLRLEHLRFGSEQPVYLFDLQPTDHPVGLPGKPHVCRLDDYFAALVPSEDHVYLEWRIEGPTKNETIRYTYR